MAGPVKAYQCYSDRGMWAPVAHALNRLLCTATDTGEPLR